MANGRFRDYYWRIRTLIAENDEIVNLESHSSEDDADYTGSLEFRLVFNDGSRFISITNLNSDDEIIENNYYYCYRNSGNVREFSYDDREHHPEIDTYPHHMHIGAESDGEDPPFATDLNPVNFFTVFQKILTTYF